MPDSFEDVVYAIGDAIIAPSLGHGELVLAVLVALAFAASAVRTWIGKGDETRQERRF